MFEGLLQPWHLLIIFLIAMVLFGGKKLPELGKGLGQAIRGFKESMHEQESTSSDASTTALPDRDKP